MQLPEEGAGEAERAVSLIDLRAIWSPFATKHGLIEFPVLPEPEPSRIPFVVFSSQQEEYEKRDKQREADWLGVLVYDQKKGGKWSDIVEKKKNNPSQPRLH